MSLKEFANIYETIKITHSPANVERIHEMVSKEFIEYYSVVTCFE